MRSSQFWIDASERAVRTFAQSLLAVFTAGVTIIYVDWKEALAIGSTAALVSVLMSIASADTGDKESASLVKAKPDSK